MDRRELGIVAATFLGQGVAVGTTMGAFTLFVRPVAQAFDASTLQVSAGISLVVLTLGVAGVFVGTWLDRGSPRAVMFTGTAILTLGLLGASQAGSLLVLGAMCVVCGVAVPMLGPLTTASVIGKAFDATRGRALGISSMGINVGGLGFALLAGFALESWGWRATLQSFAALTLALLAPAIALGVPADLAGAPSADASADVDDWTPRRLLASRAFWLAALLLGLSVGANAGWTPHVAPWLQDREVPLRVIGIVVAASQGLAVFGTLGCGLLAERRSSEGLVAAILGVQIAILGIFLLHPGVFAESIGVVVFGIVAGGFMPVYANLLAQRFGGASVGRAMGLSNLYLLPFGFGLPLLGGALRDAQGHYDTMIAVCAALLGVAMLLVVLLARAPRAARLESG